MTNGEMTMIQSHVRSVVRRLREDRRGNVLLPTLLVLAVSAVTTLALVGATSRHSAATRAAADGAAALQLARAGALRALSDLQAGNNPPISVPVPEGRGTYTIVSVTDSPPPASDYVVTSQGNVGAAEAVLEVTASRPSGASFLSMGTISLTHGSAVSPLTLRGDLLARGKVTAAENGLGSTLTLDGAVRTEGAVALSAALLSSLVVTKGVAANGGITTSGNVTFQPLGGTVAVPPFAEVPPTEYEDEAARLRACCEAPGGSFGALNVDTNRKYTSSVTVNGDMVVAPGVKVVVDGDLVVNGKLTVNGLLYVRGNAAAAGNVRVTTLSAPAAGGKGTLVAAGTVTVNQNGDVLSQGLQLLGVLNPSDPPGILKVLALHSGPGDTADDITINGVTLLSTGNPVSGILLYTGGSGAIRISSTALLKLPRTISVCAVAGGSLTVEASVLLDPLGATVSCDPAVMKDAPAPLRALRFVTARSWRQVK